MSRPPPSSPSFFFVFLFLEKKRRDPSTVVEEESVAQMSGGKVPPPGFRGPTRPPPIIPGAFGGLPMPPPELGFLLQNPELMRSLLVPLVSGMPPGYSSMGVDDDDDDGDSDLDEEKCNCPSCQGVVDRMMNTIAEFVNPILTVDHMEEARRKIHCKVDLEEEIHRVLKALHLWYYTSASLYFDLILCITKK